MLAFFAIFQLDEDVMIMLERFGESKEEENSCGKETVLSWIEIIT